MIKQYITALMLASCIGGYGQEKKQATFIPPFDFPLTLSGNFGEIRSNHFHGGLDFKTGGVVGKPVRALADGYISRIRVTNGSGRRTGLQRWLEADRPCRGIAAERRQAGAFSHADLCAGSQKTIGCLAPKYPWYGTLLRRRTDQGNALHRKQLPCGQGQYVPRSPTVQDDQGTERYGLGRDVQSVQYGTSPGSLPFS